MCWCEVVEVFDVIDDVEVLEGIVVEYVVVYESV